MRKLFLIGAGLGMLAVSGVAMAQTPPAPGGQTPPAAPDNAGPPPNGGPRGEMGPHERGPGGYMGGPGRMMAMMRGMQRDQAARFHFYRGDDGIDIRCAANESTQACVNAAGTLMDKLGAMRPNGQ